MADIRAIANGNWSAGGTWNGGVKPQAGDNAFANGFTVTIDETVTCTSINTIAGGGGAAGGSFTCTAARTINANITAGTTTCLTCTHTTGTVAITGNIIGGSSGSALGVSHSTAGTVTITGNVTGGSNSVAHGYSGTALAGPLNVTGALTGGTGSQASGLSVQSTAQTVVLVGSITGGPSSSNAQGLITLGNHTITQSGGNITGGNGNTNFGVSIGTGAVNATFTANVSAGAAGASNIGFGCNHSSGTVTINGNITATGFGGGCSFAGTGTLNINGNVTGGPTSTGNYGVAHASAGTVNIVGDLVSGTVGPAMTCSGATGTTVVTGNATSAATTAGSHVVTLSSSANFTLNGNATGPSSAALGTTNCINSTSTGTVTITGTVTAGNSTTSAGLYIQGIGTYRVGTAKSNDYPNSGIVNPNPGVQLTQNTYSCTVDALEFGSGGYCPLSAIGKWFIRAAGTNSVKMRESNAGAVVEMGEISADYPLAANVRLGTVYNSGGTTGTLAVPAANQVSVGVAIDATTGTAVLTPQTVADAVAPLLEAFGP